MSPQDFKGAPRIILTEIKDSLARGEHPSYLDLSSSTGYSHVTVYRALRILERDGAIHIERKGKTKLHYEVVEGVPT